MACIPGLGAVSGSDGIDSVFEYILLDACGLLRLHPFVPGSYGRCFPRPGSAMLIRLLETNGCMTLGSRVPSSGQRERLDG
jgi:hypothetical protein